MTAEQLKHELFAAMHMSWPEARTVEDLPFQDYWRKTSVWLAFHAPHVGRDLMKRLITEHIAKCIEAERNGTEPKAPVVPEKVRAIWAEVETPSPLAGARSVGGDGTKEREETHFGAPFSGPTPGALRRTRKRMQQGELL